MKNKKHLVFLFAAVLLIGVLIALSCADLDFDITKTAWALFPPVLAIALALITKEVYSSLFAGIVAGALMYNQFNLIGSTVTEDGLQLTGAIATITNDGIIKAVSDTAGIFIFLVILGIIVSLINKAGGSEAFGRWAVKNVKTKAGALLATFALGVLIFVDDYFNCLTVGSVMRPVTDSKKISRAKLSYLIDATAAPVCMIAPVSSWAAAVTVAVGTTSIAGQVSGFTLFCQAIPYNFYSMFTFVFIIAMVLMKVDFGPMRLHEYNAEVKGDLFTSGERNEEEETTNHNGKVIDLVLPVLALIVCCIFGLVYTGGILNGADIITAFSDCDATVGLPFGSIIALVLIVIYFIGRGLINFKESMECIPQGFFAMIPPILILTLATSLKNMTTLLGGAEYVRALMEGAASGLANFLPAVIFIVACLLAFATGTSWGTFGILIPIVVEMFPLESPMLIIGISACLAGAVCGDHCSPISDTTIMASAGAKCDHINHVSTQLPYAITVAVISFVSYILAGFTQNVVILLAFGAALTIGTLFVFKAINKKHPIETGEEK